MHNSIKFQFLWKATQRPPPRTHTHIHALNSIAHWSTQLPIGTLGWPLFIFSHFSPRYFPWHLIRSFRTRYQLFIRKIWLSRPLESQVWTMMAVLVIRCEVQLPGSSNHLIKVKCGRFAPLLCMWRFQSAMHRGSAGRYRCPEFFEGCTKLLVQKLAISWYKSSSITMSTCLILSPGVLSSRRLAKTGVRWQRYARIPTELLSWDINKMTRLGMTGSDA